MQFLCFRKLAFFLTKITFKLIGLQYSITSPFLTGLEPAWVSEGLYETEKHKNAWNINMIKV